MCVIILCYTSAPVFYGLDYRFYYMEGSGTHYSLIDTVYVAVRSPETVLPMSHC